MRDEGAAAAGRRAPGRLRDGAFHVITCSVQLPSRRDYQHVYFSPHLDDVVLSCAGRIAQQTAAGAHILVVTMFAGSAADAVRVAPALAPFQDIAARRHEDRLAVQELTADYLWLDYPDAIQRHPRYATMWGITAPMSHREAPLRAEVAATVARISQQWPAATLYFPLGIGNHVDHQLVSAAGLDQQRTDPSQPRGTLFYEDTPYVCIPHLIDQRFEQVGIGTTAGFTTPVLARAHAAHAALLAAPQLGRHLGAVARILLFGYLVARFARARGGARRRVSTTMGAELINIDAEFETKINAIGRYRSQVEALFGDLAELRRALSACSRSGPGSGLQERYWRIVEGG